MTTLRENTALRDERAVDAARPQPRPARRTPLTWVRGGGLWNLLFLLPMIVVFAVFSWSPIVQSVIMSLQKTNLITAHWVGLDNYIAVLTDPLLGESVINTLWFAVLAMIFGFPVPLFMAVLMSEVRRGKGLYSALAYLPVVIPPVVAVLLWKFFYDPRPEGVFNTVLGWVGLGPYPWIADATWAMPAFPLNRGFRMPSRRCPRWFWRRPGPVPVGRSSSTWQRCSAFRLSCMTLRKSMAPRSGARSGTSRCRRCAASSSSC